MHFLLFSYDGEQGFPAKRASRAGSGRKKGSNELKYQSVLLIIPPHIREPNIEPALE
jgi:hypothetical protein